MPRRCVPIVVDGKIVGRMQVDVRDKKCSSCGGFGATQLCDYPVTRKGAPATCDRACCAKGAVNVGPDRDYCPPHHRLSKETQP